MHPKHQATATPEQLNWSNEFQRPTTSPENAVGLLEAFADIDVRDKLSQIKVPTLIIHSRGDQRIDWRVARGMASEIRNAELVTLESKNHLLLDGEPAAEVFTSVAREFLLKEKNGLVQMTSSEDMSNRLGFCVNPAGPLVRR